MSFVYTPAKVLVGTGSLDFAGDDIRVLLVMASTNAHTEEDAEFVADLALDEFDGSGYGRQALGSQAVNENAASDRAEVDAADAVFAGLGPGTRQIVGAVIYKHVSTDANSPVIAFIDDAPELPMNGNGGALTIVWPSTGYARIE